MNQFSRLIVVIALTAAVAACSEPQSPVGPAPAATPENPSAAAPSASVAPASPPPAAAPVNSLSRTLATDRFNTRVGELVDGKLRNNSKAGFLLFGPYIAFSPGTYTVAIKGKVEQLPPGQKVRLDVVSNKGKTSHGQAYVEQTGELPAFEFTLPDAARDLEVRVMVPGGSQVAVESYVVSSKN